MSKVTDIRSHPKFWQNQELDPDDPDFEHQQYLRYLDAGELKWEMEGAERLGEARDETRSGETADALFEKLIPVELAVCAHCLYSRDPRTLWQKIQGWFLIRKSNKPICTHGIVQYCQDKNSMGDCPAFRPTHHYR